MADVTAEIAAVDNLPAAIIPYPTASYTTGAVNHFLTVYDALKSMRDQWGGLDAGGGGGSGGATAVVAAPTGTAATDTTAVQTALNGGGLVMLSPAGGTYSITPQSLYMPVDGTTFDLNGCTLELATATATHDVVLSVFNPTSAAVAGNRKNITIRNGTMIVNDTPPTFASSHQYQHGIVLSGVSDCVVENVKIVGPRGDGIYLGSGHGSALHGSGIERHNERITIRNCVFDGVNKLNRNGISVIDSTDLHVEDCFFYRFSDTTMPGAFDIEPNNTYNICRNIEVVGCTVDDGGGGVGQFACAFITQTQAAMTVPIQNITFRDCTVRNCNTGNAFYAVQSGNPGVDVEPNNILVDNLHASDGWCRPFSIYGGVRGVTIRNSKFFNLDYSCQLGWDDPVQDLVVEGNSFYKVGDGESKLFTCYQLARVKFRNNTFEGVKTTIWDLRLNGTPVGSTVDLEISGNAMRQAATPHIMTSIATHNASHTITGFKYSNNDDLGLALAATITSVKGRTPTFNASVSTPGAGFASDTYLVGSSCAIPRGSLQAKSMYRCRFNVTKTAAGTATPIINVRIGTAGTTSDTSRGTLTWSAQTAAVDDGVFEIACTFRTVGSGTSAVLQSLGSLRHSLSVTGLGTAVSESEVATSGGFDSTVGDLVIGLSVNGGTSAAWTISLVQAELFNLAA